MGAREPYVAYIRGAIAEVRGYGIGGYQGCPPFAEALNTFIKSATRYDDDFITTGVELLVSMVSKGKTRGVGQAYQRLACGAGAFVSD